MYYLYYSTWLKHFTLIDIQLKIKNNKLIQWSVTSEYNLSAIVIRKTIENSKNV